MIHVSRTFLVTALLAAGALLSPRWLRQAVLEKIRDAARWLNSPTPRNRATAMILIWIVALIPMVRMTYWVLRYAVNVPTLDDWEMAPLIVQAHTGQLTWTSFFTQQQEGWTVLPRLIFVLSTFKGYWDVRDMMMLSLVCCWLTTIGIFILLRRSGLNLAALAVSLWLAAITIFTPAQFELWIFAFGFPSFLPALLIVAALVIVGTDRLHVLTKFALCGVLAIASSFTLPNGLLAWGLMFPALLMMRRVRRWPWWLAGWGALCALCALAYFWQYQKPKNLPTFAPAVSPTDYVRFFLEFLGGGLAYAWKERPELCALIFGACQIALFLAALFFAMTRIRDRAFLASAAPWFSVALYSVGCAFLATLGRVEYGTRYALSSRYVTFSLYLLVGVVVLGAIIVQAMMRERSVRWRRWSYAFCVLLLLAYLVPYKVCAFNTAFFLRALSAKDRLAHAAVLISPVLDTSEIIMATAYPHDARPVIEGADALDRVKLLRPALFRTDRLDALPHEAANGMRAEGSCESITHLENNLVRVSGWAVLNEKGRPPDCVALAYQLAADQPWVLFAISDSFAMQAEIVKRFRTMEQLWSGWSATFPSSALPAGAKLSFWAVDADEPRLYQLKDESRPTTR